MTSISDIASSELSQLALQRWPSAEAAAASRYDATLVQHIYHRYLMPSGPASGRGAGSERVSPRQLLEYSSYLEFYLWQHYSDSVPFEHAMSIVIVSVRADGHSQSLVCRKHRAAQLLPVRSPPCCWRGMEPRLVHAPPLLMEWRVGPAACLLLGCLLASATLLCYKQMRHRLLLLPLSPLPLWSPLGIARDAATVWGSEAGCTFRCTVAGAKPVTQTGVRERFDGPAAGWGTSGGLSRCRAGARGTAQRNRAADGRAAGDGSASPRQPGAAGS